MGTSLTGVKIKDSYPAILKVTDNGALDGSLQVITDGLGNNSALSLSTAGASVTGTLAVSGGITGTLSTAAQPNITSVGTLSSLSFFGGASATLGLSIEPSGWGGSKHRFTVPTSGDASVLSFNYNGSSVDSATYATSSLTLSNGYALISTGDINQAPTQRFKVNYNGDISFRDSSANEAFYWDASAASLGIGTASPSVKLHVKGAAGTGSVLRLEPTTSTTIYSQVVGTNGDLVLQADPLNNEGSTAIKFEVDGTERMRITSEGDVLFGKDTISISSLGVGFDASTSSLSSTIINSEVTYTLYNSTTAGYTFYVKGDGGVANYSANDTNLSDERVKTDISPLDSYWDKIKAIEIVNFKYKDQTHDDFNIGVIAQQVESIAPEFVDVDGYKTEPKLISEEVIDEEGNLIQEAVYEEPLAEPLKAVYTTDLYHAAIKVLQEAMARIEVLETELNALKQA